MKVGLIGVSHWHTGMYVNALLKLGEDIIAISDRNEELVKSLSRAIGCKYYTDYVEMVEDEELDFVFSFGRHVDMPKIIGLLIKKGIPFLTEKPAGINHKEVLELARLAESKELFAGVAFAIRSSTWAQEVIESRNFIGDLNYLYFRYVTGPPTRYVSWRCPWMLKRDEAGGGCLINLGVHFIDLVYYLTGEEIELEASIVDNRNYKLEVEDYAVLMLRTKGGRTGVVEIAYTPSKKVETYYSLIGNKGIAVVRGREFILANGERVLKKELSNDHYFRFIRLTLEAYKKGRKPLATLSDMVRVLRIVNQAYESVGKR